MTQRFEAYFLMKKLDGNLEIYSLKGCLNLTNLPNWCFFPALFTDGRISFVSNVEEKRSPTFKNVYEINRNNTDYNFLLSIEEMSMENISNT